MVYIIIIAVTFLLDQLSKAYFYKVFGKTLINNFLGLDYIENRGAAYGLLSNSKYGQLFFFVLTVVFLILLFVFYIFTEKKSKWFHTSLAFVIGGTLGNFVDRISLKYVRDFLQVSNPFKIRLFDFMNFTCNVADIFLCVGAFMLIIYLLFMDKDAIFKRKKKD